MEYLPGGELIKLIKTTKFVQEGPELKFYMAEIVSAVESLHSKFAKINLLGQNIVFRDMKPENILLDHHGHIRLIDFGFSKMLRHGVQERIRTNCGTPGYVAPEIMLSDTNNGAGYDGKKADIWSIGILLCEMVGGFTPFRNQQTM